MSDNELGDRLDVELSVVEAVRVADGRPFISEEDINNADPIEVRTVTPEGEPDEEFHTFDPWSD